MAMKVSSARRLAGSCAVKLDAFACLLLSAVSMAPAQDPLFDADRPLEIADQGAFSVPGRYVMLEKDNLEISAFIRRSESEHVH
jgi:hypothetical protein